MAFNFTIPTPGGEQAIEVRQGSSLIIVGANGGGKTRLAVKIEENSGSAAHRISAHRSLALNPGVAKISELRSLAALRTGIDSLQAGLHHREGHRWGSQAAVKLLNDFDYVIQALFADQSNVTVAEYEKRLAGDHTTVKLTKMVRLKNIWNELLPHRVVHITGDDIQVSAPGGNARYSAAEMSDGERAVFYVIGQALLAATDSMLIIDEPELHMHRSILSKLWDAIEAARPDCAFVYITHDLEFAAARAAQKFVVHHYVHPDKWSIEGVPEETGFSEALATLILGSRRPILFVESTEGGLDVALYRSCYPDHTVIARGSCEEVKHSVVSLRRNAALTRVTCSGIVDADGLHGDEIDALSVLGVAVLPVSEIENLFLLPSVSRAIAEGEGYAGAELETRLVDLQERIFQTLADTAAVDAVVLRYCRRRIDRLLKKLDFGEANSVAALGVDYTKATSELDIAAIAEVMRERIVTAVDAKDLTALLAVYDNKGLLSLAASSLRNQKLGDFKSWLTRVLRGDARPELRTAIETVLPAIGS